MEEVIVLDEGTRGVGEKGLSGGRRMGCSRGIGSANCSAVALTLGVNGDVLRETCWKPLRWGVLSSFFFFFMLQPQMTLCSWVQFAQMHFVEKPFVWV